MFVCLFLELLILKVNSIVFLDGPCSLDFSKMKTPENSWNDPSAQELVQRHKIYRSPSQSSNSFVTPKRRRLFMSSPKLNSSIPGVPMLARQHVDSLHQNVDTQLLYGKNNVAMNVVGFSFSFFSFFRIKLRVLVWGKVLTYAMTIYFCGLEKVTSSKF